MQNALLNYYCHRAEDTCALMEVIYGDIHMHGVLGWAWVIYNSGLTNREVVAKKGVYVYIFNFMATPVRFALVAYSSSSNYPSSLII